MAQNQALLIVGPHRSGTSALTRVLNLLGVDLGNETLPPKFDNPRGYWENRRIFDLHERLLSEMDSSWHDYRPVPPDAFRRDGVADLRDELRRTLLEELAPSPLWAVKDPRLCKLLPLWQEMLDDLHIEAKFIVVVRHPLEVARSLDIRDPFAWSKCLLLCLSDMVAALRHTEGRRRAFISFAALLEDWESTVESLGRILQVDWPNDPRNVRDKVEAFLQPSERHHRHSLADLRAEPGLPPWTVRLYEALDEACLGSTEQEPDFSPFVDSYLDASRLFVPEINLLEEQVGHARSLYRDALGELEESHATQKRLEERAQAVEKELQEVQSRLTNVLSSRLYRYTRPARRAWYRLAHLLGMDRR